MISFRCSHCGKELKVKDELAGKKGKCPGCGKPIAVPQVAASVSPPPAGQERTLPPKAPAPADERTLPPKMRNADAAGHTAVGAGQAADTRTFPAEGGRQSVPQMYDFLAPAEGPDEIGRLGPYRVLKVLGAGGMGVVFKAHDPHLDRLVALKAMLPSMASVPNAKERFFREAKAAAALKHPHIVGIYYVGEDRGAPFLAMEFLEGEPLDERLKRDKRLPIADVVRIGREVAEGLAAAHQKGLIHRDIKPANLWLEVGVPPSGGRSPAKAGTPAQVKILDFGLARALAEQTQLTQQGAIIGTPAYMAPEQAGGKAVDHRCDLFSLGCVLYRMCTGQMAFKGDDTISILSAIATETPATPAELNEDVPEELSELIMSLLSKKAENRPFSAHDVVKALHELEGDTDDKTVQRSAKRSGVVAGVVARSPDRATGKGDLRSGAVARSGDRATTGGDRATTAPRKKWLLAGAGGVLAAIVVVGFLILRPGNDPTSRERERPENEQQTGPLPATFTNSLGMEFVLVPKGKFLMGGGGGTVGDKEVEIGHDFYLGKYEVTQGEWEAVMGVNPSHFSRSGAGRNDVVSISSDDLKKFPVEQVSWNDCQEFLIRLNKRVNESGWVYRLPKEAEWEYACRGGPLPDKKDYGFDFYFDRPTNTLLPDGANFQHDKGLKRTCKVGSYKPNRLGLYDMHGNGWEWCQDEVPQPKGASFRVYRGGSCQYASGGCRAASRALNSPAFQHNSLGLRLARVPVVKQTANTFTNGLGMEFVLVPKGKFLMGGGGGTVGDKEVEIGHDFYLGRYEVTQEEWEKVTGLSVKAVAGIGKEDQKLFPVEMVSWDECQVFIERLNKQVKEAGWVYRLPTEVEWEYGCRGGPMKDKLESAFDFYFEKASNTLLPDQANFAHGKGLKRNCKVGSYQPNRLGLYDMHGNVWEWCADELKDDKGVSRRGNRGGCWSSDARGCRAAYRYSNPPSHRYYALGLRLARVPVGKAP